MANGEINSNHLGWQVIALSSEIPASSPVSRQFDDDKYVIFRDNDKVVRVLEDYCVHRRAPLSLGRVTPEGWIQCPYHGWTYDGALGHCQNIPNLSSKETIPKDIKVENFTTKESGGLVYLWRGERGKQDAPLPNIHNVNLDNIKGEGSCLITLPYKDLIDTLVDSPSLILDFNLVDIIDDHWMGEPVLDGQYLTVNRVADWKALAGRRKKIPSDYPLILSINVDLKTSIITIELRDENDTVLVNVLMASYPVTSAISSVVWLWSVQTDQSSNLTEKMMAACQKIKFTVSNTIDANALLAGSSYISSVMRGYIESSQ